MYTDIHVDIGLIIEVVDRDERSLYRKCTLMIENCVKYKHVHNEI